MPKRRKKLIEMRTLNFFVFFFFGQKYLGHRGNLKKLKKSSFVPKRRRKLIRTRTLNFFVFLCFGFGNILDIEGSLILQ